MAQIRITYTDASTGVVVGTRVIDADSAECDRLLRAHGRMDDLAKVVELVRARHEARLKDSARGAL